MKKGTTESLSALIGLIIAILILTPMIIFGYRYLSSLNSNVDCFNEIVDNVNKLKDGEEKVILCKINKRSSFFGFDNDETEVKSYNRLVWQDPFANVGSVLAGIPIKEITSFHYKKPKSTCLDNLACLCLCGTDGKIIDKSGKVIQKKDILLECKGKTKCAQFKGIKKLSGLIKYDGLESENSDQFYIFLSEGPLALKLKKIKDKLLICDPNKECTIQASSFNMPSI
ncbi:hypothetical protein D6777_04655, partial [Candidatus Woesearchaeota archaeon]